MRQTISCVVVNYTRSVKYSRSNPPYESGGPGNTGSRLPISPPNKQTAPRMINTISNTIIIFCIEGLDETTTDLSTAYSTLVSESAIPFRKSLAAIRFLPANCTSLTRINPSSAAISRCFLLSVRIVPAASRWFSILFSVANSFSTERRPSGEISSGQFRSALFRLRSQQFRSKRTSGLFHMHSSDSASAGNGRTKRFPLRRKIFRIRIQDSRSVLSVILLRIP